MAQLPAHVVASDALRQIVGEGPHDLGASRDAFELLDRIVEARLRRQLTTVVDSLGTDAVRRARWLVAARNAGMPCVAVVFDTPATEVRRRNRARPERVPDGVLRRQLAEWPAVRDAVLREPFDAHHVLVSDER